MSPTPPVDPAPPSNIGFGELRCRSYLFRREWEDLSPPAPEGAPPRRSANNPAPGGARGRG
jgi:hypothetical protein